MKKKWTNIFLVVAVLFACWLQFPVGLHIKEVIPGAVASCVEPGLTEGQECALCGKVLAVQQVVPATGIHIYDDDFDKSCNTCSYIREVNSVFEFVNHRVVLRDENENHKNWRVIVYKLGDQAVDKLSDEAALQAADPAAKTYWHKKGIDKICLTEPGNYVLMLKYDDGDRAGIKVPMAITIADEPALLVEEGNRICVMERNENNRNHTLTVFYLADATVANPEIEDDVRNAAVSAKTYTGLEQINETVILEGGNYVLYLRYETVDCTEHTIAVAKTLAGISESP